MSRRRTAEVVAALLQAFLEEGTWSQADLARRAKTTPETIRKTLEDLRNAGWPLERELDPPQVYWSIPIGWLPAGILVPMERATDLLRLLSRLPSDEDRDAMIRFFVSSSPAVCLALVRSLGSSPDRPRPGHVASRGRGRHQQRPIAASEILLGP